MVFSSVVTVLGQPTRHPLGKNMEIQTIRQLFLILAFLTNGCDNHVPTRLTIVAQSDGLNPVADANVEINHQKIGHTDADGVLIFEGSMSRDHHIVVRVSKESESFYFSPFEIVLAPGEGEKEFVQTLVATLHSVPKGSNTLPTSAITQPIPVKIPKKSPQAEAPSADLISTTQELEAQSPIAQKDLPQKTSQLPRPPDSDKDKSNQKNGSKQTVSPQRTKAANEKKPSKPKNEIASTADQTKPPEVKNISKPATPEEVILTKKINLDQPALPTSTVAKDGKGAPAKFVAPRQFKLDIHPYAISKTSKMFGYLISSSGWKQVPQPLPSNISARPGDTLVLHAPGYRTKTEVLSNDKVGLTLDPGQSLTVLVREFASSRPISGVKLWLNGKLESSTNESGYISLPLTSVDELLALKLEAPNKYADPTYETDFISGQGFFLEKRFHPREQGRHPKLTVTGWNSEIIAIKSSQPTKQKSVKVKMSKHEVLSFGSGRIYREFLLKCAVENSYSLDCPRPENAPRGRDAGWEFALVKPKKKSATAPSEPKKRPPEDLSKLST